MNPENCSLYDWYDLAVASKYKPFNEAKHIKMLSDELTYLAFNKEGFQRLCVAMPPSAQ